MMSVVGNWIISFWQSLFNSIVSNWGILAAFIMLKFVLPKVIDFIKKMFIGG